MCMCTRTQMARKKLQFRLARFDTLNRARKGLSRHLGSPRTTPTRLSPPVTPHMITVVVTPDRSYYASDLDIDAIGTKSLVAILSVLRFGTYASHSTCHR